jgi:hypothetical protein
LQPLSPAAEEEEEVAELEEEVGDRDPTYLRTRVVFSYDHRELEGPASLDRFRSKLLYAFGPKQRFGMSVIMPVLHRDTVLGAVRGSGDAEVQASGNIYYAERLRMGAATQATFQTASDPRLGGASTIIKPSLDLTGVFSSRVEVTSAIYYKRSIRTVRGVAARQLEPDITINTRVLNTTLFLEWDSYYDYIPGRLAQTTKAGVSRRFGGDRPWVASAYYAAGINDYGRRSQYRYNAGFDFTWYPLKYR